MMHHSVNGRALFGVSLSTRRDRNRGVTRATEHQQKKSGLAIEFSRAPSASPYHHEEQPSISNA